jgi:hypothetical protein
MDLIRLSTADTVVRVDLDFIHATMRPQLACNPGRMDSW